MVPSDKELEAQLLDAGKKLISPPSSTDQLLPLLDHVEDCLSKVEQSPRKSMQEALSTLQKALVAEELLKHSEPDVQIAVASCISEITRISAPEAPYEDDAMKEVFQLIVSSFGNLSTLSSRSYVKRVSILETVAKVRSCVVMLDLECDSLIIEMFRHFLKEIRDYHEENVFTSMETIMTLVIDESEEITPELLFPVLDSVKKDESYSPMAKKLGEKVLKNCAMKLKPYLREIINSLGANLDDFNAIVASVCSGTNGVAEESNAHIMTEERPVLPLDGPDSVASPHTIVNNGLTSIDKSLGDSSNLKKEEDDGDYAASKQSNNVNRDKQLDNDIVAKVEQQPEQNSEKAGKELSSSAEALNLVNDSMIAEDGSQKKEEQEPDNRSMSPLPPVLPAESEVEAAAAVPSSNTLENESTDTGSKNQNDELPTNSKAHEKGSSKQEDEVEEDEIPSTGLDKSKPEDKEDLSGEVDAAKEGGMNDNSCSAEKTLTAEDSVKDTEATSDSAATKSNQSNKKVNAKPEKRKGISGRIDAEQETAKLPKQGKDALKSSKNSDKKEMVQPLKGSGKGKPCSVETPKGSLKREDTPGKEEGNGAKKDGAALVGSKIKVWWPMDKAFYKGRVVDFDAVTKKHRILYFDGDVEVLSLRKERWEIIKDNSRDEDEGEESESSDASLERPPKSAKLKATQSATKQGKLVSTPKQIVGVSSSSTLKGGTATSAANHKSKEGSKASDLGGESSFRTPEGGQKSIDTSLEKVDKSKDKDASTSSKVMKPKGDVSGPKDPLKSKHVNLETSGKSKSKQESNSNPVGKLLKSPGKSGSRDGPSKVKPSPAKSEDSEATDEEEEEDSPTVAPPSKKARKLSGSSSASTGRGGKSGRGKKRRRGA
ncbi:hypothetical protein MLD38_006407 [Melastoma candidum]|uniref:Uncharacterized protein n=1 Tax=Melastoma candidum TaxID=119954 RepID=A0ACB9RMG4_9MYRT|nr:hypothetical protein MLD38_006407 [Melastoma candidum]